MLICVCCSLLVVLVDWCLSSAVCRRCVAFVARCVLFVLACLVDDVVA